MVLQNLFKKEVYAIVVLYTCLVQDVLLKHKRLLISNLLSKFVLNCQIKPITTLASCQKARKNKTSNDILNYIIYIVFISLL